MSSAASKADLQGHLTTVYVKSYKFFYDLRKKDFLGIEQQPVRVTIQHFA